MEDGVDEAFSDVCRGASVNWSTLKAETQQSGRTKSRPIDPDCRDRADLLRVKAVLASDWHPLLFPTRPSPRYQAVPEFETTAQG
jgi:hypothetical protein